MCIGGVLLSLLLQLTAAGWQVSASRPSDSGSMDARAGSPDPTLRREIQRWNREQAAKRGALAFFSDAELTTWLDLLARRHAKAAKELYKLTPEQEVAVERRLEELRGQALAFWKEHRPEMQRIARRLKQLPAPSTPGTGDGSLMEERRALLRRQVELMQQQPLHVATAFTAIEQLLPAEQVRAAAARRERGAIDWPGTPAGYAERGYARLELAPVGSEELPDDGEAAFGDWQRYVAIFIRLYGLDPGQRSTAWSILRDLQDRRDAYEASHQSEFDAARKLADRNQRRQRLSRLSEPIRELFQELRRRLEEIPTAAQRQRVAEKARKAPPATRRALGGASSRAPGCGAVAEQSGTA